MAFVADGDREFEFRPLATVATPEPLTQVQADTGRLSFISGSFGRTFASSVAEATMPSDTETESPRSRWGVGYIAGVGPTESVEESRPLELFGSTAVPVEADVREPRDFRGLVSLALATMILLIVGVAWYVTSSATRSTTQPTVKSAPLPPPAVQAPSSVPNPVVTQPQTVAPVAPVAPAVNPPASRYVPPVKKAAPVAAVKPPAPVLAPPPSSAPTPIAPGHHNHGSLQRHGGPLFQHQGK